MMARIIVTPTAVETRKDSYKLSTITVVSVRRPFLALGMMGAVGGGAFTARFADLLHAHETMTLCGAIGLLLAAGIGIGHLQLLSRDVRGTELSGAAWGLFWQLNARRREIMRAAQAMDAEAGK